MTTEDLPTPDFAPAKINLSLHVTGQRSDGYHILDSLVVFADVGDKVSLWPSAEMSLRVTGPYASGVPTDDGNLVWRAAALCGLVADIALEKHLPHAAGIGGGSADAAAVVRAAGKLGFSPSRDLASLGADVPVCLSCAPQRMQGIGEQLSPVDGMPDLWMVLVNPRVDVPTSTVFAGLKTKSNAPMGQDLPMWRGFDAFCSWLADQRNDLEAPAIQSQPIIADALKALSDAALARMSGSGATCFGLYPSAEAADLAAKRITKDHPDWWSVAVRVLKAS